MALGGPTELGALNSMEWVHIERSEKAKWMSAHEIQSKFKLDPEALETCINMLDKMWHSGMNEWLYKVQWSSERVWISIQ